MSAATPAWAALTVAATLTETVAANRETPGEDPTLNADYAEGFVGGFQEGEDDSSRIKASSCCKHYAACEPTRLSRLVIVALPVLLT